MRLVPHDHHKVNTLFNHKLINLIVDFLLKKCDNTSNNNHNRISHNIRKC